MLWMTAALLMVQDQSGYRAPVLQCVREVSPRAVDDGRPTAILANLIAEGCMTRRYRSNPFEICARRVGLFITVRFRKRPNPNFDGCRRGEERSREETRALARTLSARLIAQGRAAR